MGAPQGAVCFYGVSVETERRRAAWLRLATRRRRDRRRATDRFERYLPTRRRRHDRDAGIASERGRGVIDLRSRSDSTRSKPGTVSTSLFPGALASPGRLRRKSPVSSSGAEMRTLPLVRLTHVAYSCSDTLDRACHVRFRGAEPSGSMIGKPGIGVVRSCRLDTAAVACRLSLFVSYHGPTRSRPTRRRRLGWLGTDDAESGRTL
jgi:hypothetical protein